MENGLALCLFHFSFMHTSLFVTFIITSNSVQFVTPVCVQIAHLDRCNIHTFRYPIQVIDVQCRTRRRSASIYSLQGSFHNEEHTEWTFIDWVQLAEMLEQTTLFSSSMTEKAQRQKTCLVGQSLRSVKPKLNSNIKTVVGKRGVAGH